MFGDVIGGKMSVWQVPFKMTYGQAVTIKEREKYLYSVYKFWCKLVDGAFVVMTS